MKTKQFDCVEMMHCGARRIYQATKSMSRKAELTYWQTRADELFPPSRVVGKHASVVREPRASYRTSR